MWPGVVCRSWGGSPSKANGHANGTTGPSPSALLAHKIATLLQLEDLSDLFSRAFLDTVPQVCGMSLVKLIEADRS